MVEANQRVLGGEDGDAVCEDFEIQLDEQVLRHFCIWKLPEQMGGESIHIPPSWKEIREMKYGYSVSVSGYEKAETVVLEIMARLKSQFTG